ncbi:MAG: ABC transporter ATP-binding protein/permease [Butyrivibrio sp.]|nr:ABC transporter ATP-binding protein/permease [Butyrivibrio sp.]
MKEIIRELRIIFNRKQKLQLVVLCILMFGGALWELLGVSAVIPFVTAIINPASLLANPLVSSVYNFLKLESSQQLIILMAVFLILVYVVKNVYLCIMAYFQYSFTFKNQYRLSQQLLANYINRPYSFHLNNSSAELMRNIKDDTDGCYSFVLCVMQLISETAVCAALTVFLFIKDKSITIGITILLTMYVLLYLLVMKKQMRRLGVREREQLRLMNKWIMEALGGIKETKILMREKYFQDKYNANTDRLAHTKTSYSIITYIAKPTVETVCIGGLLSVVAMKIYSGVDASYFIPIVSVFAVAAFRLLPSLNRITTYLSMIMLRKPSVDALYKDINDIRKNNEYTNVKEDSQASELIFEHQIEMKDISFRYEGTEKDVLSDVEIVIPKNKSVAFIGPSGGGKTTLADILLGILEPDKGQIVIDGKDIKENKKAWYGKLGYIPQTIFLLDDTIKNNIVFGVPEEEIDNDRLIAAMKEAQIYEFVMEQPEGWDTAVGERGVRLSGGQRQRIGIARALYHNPEILILDEATSALDNDTESAIMDAIERLGKTKTLVIIAHRLSTIKNCDIVYKVDKQKVIRDGRDK